MKTMLKAALLGSSLMLAPSLAHAQAVAVADVPAAVQRSTAYTVAVGQIKTTYAAQIAQVDARQKAIQAELQPMVTAFQAAQRAPSPNQAALQTQYNAIQAKQQAAQQELQRLSLPFARAQAYVEEQITGADGAKLNAAIRAAMTARGVQMIISPQATISYAPAVDITDAIAGELNKTTPTANIMPPANWAPGGAAAAPAAAAPASPTAPKPPGR